MIGALGGSDREAIDVGAQQIIAEDLAESMPDDPILGRGGLCDRIAIDPAYDEWDAWHCICHELKKRNVDPNGAGASKLFDAIRLWGAEFAALQRHEIQVGDLDPDQSLRGARKAYPDAKKVAEAWRARR